MHNVLRTTICVLYTKKANFVPYTIYHVPCTFLAVWGSPRVAHLTHRAHLLADHGVVHHLDEGRDEAVGVTRNLHLGEDEARAEEARRSGATLLGPHRELLDDGVEQRLHVAHGHLPRPQPRAL